MADTVETAKRRRISGLEVLRGYAAFAVLLFHIEALYLPLPAGALKSTIEIFSAAVPLFFALSAYSLLYGYSSRIFDQQSLLRFYVRRVFRIFPLFYLMLALWQTVRHFDGVWTSRAEILLNMLFLYPLLPGKHDSLVSAGWSLGNEWMFYLIFPIFALLARSSVASAAAFGVCILLSLAVFAIATDMYGANYSYLSVLNHTMFFQAGVLAYSFAVRADLGKLQKKSGWLIAGSIGVIVLNRYTLSLNFLILFAFVCGLWVVCAHSGLPGWIDNAMSRYLGRISYSLYLVHMWVLTLVARTGVFEYGYFTGLLGIAIVLLVASFTYRYIETPGRSLGERLLAAQAEYRPGGEASIKKPR